MEMNNLLTCAYNVYGQGMPYAMCTICLQAIHLHFLNPLLYGTTESIMAYGMNLYGT